MPSASSRRIYARLLRYVLVYWRTLALALAAMVVTAITEPAMPALLKPLLDGGFVEKDQTIIRLIPLLLVALALARGVSGYISQVAIAKVAGSVVRDLRREQFARILALPTAEFDNLSAGVLLSKVTFDANRVMRAGTDAVVVLVRDSLAVIGLLTWMIYLDWRLTLIVFSVVPLVIVVVRFSAQRMRRMNTALQDAMGHMSRVLEEAIAGHKLVKIFAGQEYENRRFQALSEQQRDFEVTVQATSNLSIFIVQMLIAIVLAIIIAIATRQAAADALSVGTFVSLFTAMGLLFAPIKRLTRVNEQLQQGLAAAQSVFELIDQIPEADTAPQADDVGALRLRGEVAFAQLSFRYASEERDVLRDITFTARAGETIALVGMSGSGKTSLVSLLPRFYRHTGGELRLDGQAIETIPLAVLRANIALVSQEIVLFNDTVAANIAYGGMSHASRAAVEEAARAAHAMEFIERLPLGLDTLIGERGMKLSGGQRQRLAIARALLKDAPILIFDEATSALDSHSEQLIQASMQHLRQGRTCFIIAHRLSTVEQADRIIVLEHGQIIETGTHAELLARNGTYAHLYHMQAG